jgi:hypothetical protein
VLTCYYFSTCWSEDFERRSRRLFPNGIPLNFLRKFQTIAHSHRRRFKNENERLLYFYRAGFDEESIFKAALETLDKKNREILLRSMARETENRNRKVSPDVDVTICWLHHTGILAHCSAKEAIKRITEFLRDHGFSGMFTPLTLVSYRRRVQRLRRLGVM